MEIKEIKDAYARHHKPLLIRNALKDFFYQIICKGTFFCDIEIILICDSNFFPDLCFRVHLWSWRPYMRILWILDQTRNSFWRESFFKQIFVQKCHIKVRLGWLEDKCLWSVKMTATAWKYTKYKLKIIKVWNSTIYLYEF